VYKKGEKRKLCFLSRAAYYTLLYTENWHLYGSFKQHRTMTPSQVSQAKKREIFAPLLKCPSQVNQTATV
jgi:hypothetical protein